MTQGRARTTISAHVREDVLRIPVRSYGDPGSMLNLATNEFIHPTVTRLHGSALAAVSPESLRSYTTHQVLLDEIAAHFGFDRATVLVTAGYDDALRILTDAVFATTGRMFVQAPNYSGVVRYARLRGIDAVQVSFSVRRPDDAVADPLLDALERGPPASVVISNPNGPLGYCLPLAEATRLADACTERGDLLVIDEAYVGYNGFDHRALLGSSNVLLARSLSKSFGLAGARLAFLTGSEELIEYLGRWSPANAVSTATAQIARYLLQHDAELEQARTEVVQTREWFAGRVAERFPSWQSLPSSANFVTIDVGTVTRARAVRDLLATHGVLAKGMEAYPSFESCIRLGVTDRGTMERVWAILEQLDP